MLCRTCLYLCYNPDIHFLVLIKIVNRLKNVKLTKEYGKIYKEHMTSSLEFICVLVSYIKSFTDSRLLLGDCACPLQRATIIYFPTPPHKWPLFSFVHHQQFFKVLMVNFIVAMCRT